MFAVALFRIRAFTAGNVAGLAAAPSADHAVAPSVVKYQVSVSAQRFGHSRATILPDDVELPELSPGSELVRIVLLGGPVELEVVDEVAALAEGVLGAGNDVVSAGEGSGRDLDAEEPVVVVGVGLEGDQVVVIVGELDGWDHALPVDLSDRVQVGVAACPGHQVRGLGAVGVLFGESLVVVHVAGEDDVWVAAGLLGCLLDEFLHRRAAGVVVVGRVRRVVQRDQQRDVLGQVAQFADEPVGLRLLDVAAFGDVAVEPDDVDQWCDEGPVDVGLDHRST